MTLDELSILVDKLWISALRGFNPNTIEFNGIGEIQRDTSRPLREICKKTDRRIYLIVPDGKEVSLDYQYLGGWAGDGFTNTFDGYDTSRYSSFKDGCLGKEAPKDPMVLSFKEALEFYGRIDILQEYERRKEAYDLGVTAARNWPEFLTVRT